MRAVLLILRVLPIHQARSAEAAPICDGAKSMFTTDTWLRPKTWYVISFIEPGASELSAGARPQSYMRRSGLGFKLAAAAGDYPNPNTALDTPVL